MQTIFVIRFPSSKEKNQIFYLRILLCVLPVVFYVIIFLKKLLHDVVLGILRIFSS